ncbi:hypothetical protein K466DRAFT_660070 [Polyporus arcularius HHB13444]|uniref:Uncharacterized protein n=1 Tax=Polyporus arcularius HHB13444 TaxID=1314778 RepID=A0A5C3PUG8_9APHY|nr:hypothetical protein K466DRAFT_660070 [Polyporus arcularius HHB13444]
MVKTRSSKNASQAASLPPQAGPATTSIPHRKRSTTSAKAKKAFSKPCEKGMENNELVIFELPMQPEGWELLPHPRSPKSDKCRTNEGNLLSTREQVRRWTFLNRCDHIMWFDASQVYCTPCDKVIELRGKKHGVYEVYHYVKHWERKHQPKKDSRKKGMTSGKPRRTATRCSSQPQILVASPTPELSSDDSADMAVDSDATPLPQTPDPLPTMQLPETHHAFKSDRRTVSPLEPSQALWYTSSDPGPSTDVVTAKIGSIPPRELVVSHDRGEDGTHHVLQPRSEQLNPCGGPKCELSPTLHALTGLEVHLDLAAVQDTVPKTLAPTLQYGSPESRLLGELADFAEMKPHTANTDSDSGDLETRVERVLCCRKSVSRLGLQLETSDLRLRTWGCLLPFPGVDKMDDRP